MLHLIRDIDPSVRIPFAPWAFGAVLRGGSSMWAGRVPVGAGIARAFVVALAAVAALALMPVAHAEVIDLRARFDRETPTVYEVDLNTRQALSLGEVTQDYTATYRSRVAIALERATPELITMKLTHQRIAVSFEGRGGGAPGSLPMGSYDSDQPDAAGTSDLYRQIVAPVVGKSLLIDLLPTGEIVAIRGLNDVAPPPPHGQMFRELFTEQTFHDMYGWLFALKTNPSTAKPGESWTVTQSGNSPLGTVRRVYELTLSPEPAAEGIVSVAITGRNELQGSVPGMFEEKAPSDGKPAVTGTVEWDTGKGQVRSLSSASRSNFESSTPGMPVKMTVHAETKVTRVGR